jgi:DNA-dependent RNA polymerase auxiliary subunit epsilon
MNVLQSLAWSTLELRLNIVAQLNVKIVLKKQFFNIEFSILLHKKAGIASW